jgi:hypothetical protein
MNKWLIVLLILLLIEGLVLVQYQGVAYATTFTYESDTLYLWDFEPDIQGWTHTNGQPFPAGWDRQPSNIHTPPPSAGSWGLWIESNGSSIVSDSALSPRVVTPPNLYLLKWGVEYATSSSYDYLAIGLNYKTSGVWNGVELRRYSSSFNGWDSVDVSDYFAAESIQVYAYYSAYLFAYWAGIDNIELRGVEQLQHDVGVSAVISPPGGNVLPGNYDVIGRVRNYGANTESFPVTAIVYDTTAGWTPIFNQTRTLTNFPALHDSLVNFGQVNFAWQKVYQTVIFTQLAGDQDMSNDTAKVLSKTDVARLSIEPDTIIAPPPAPGDTFTVSVTVNNVTNLSAWQFGMMFNPVLLQCLSVTEGPFLQQGGSTWWQPPNFISNNAGWIDPFACLILGGGSVSGSGAIAYIKFQVVNRDSGGISILDFEDAGLLAPGGANIPFDIVNGYFLSQLPPPKDSSDFWVFTKAPMLTGHANLAAVSVNNKIYAMGSGVLYGNASDTVEVYDPVTDTWTLKSPLPTPRYHLGAAEVDSKIYAIGGYNGGVLKTNEEYEPITDTWISKTPMLTARYGLGAATVNDKIYAIGGKYLNTNEEYDPITNTWTSKAPMPTSRAFLAVIACNGKIYAIGGDIDGSTYVAINEEYDPVTDTWTNKTPMPAPRAYVTGTAVNGKIYVMGGVNANPGYAQLTTYEYNPSADTSGGTPWVVKRGMSRTIRGGHAAASISDRLYVLGGWVSTSTPRFKHNFMYIPYSEIIGIHDRNQQFVDGAVALRVYPNPFSKKTEIRFSMLDAGYQITDVRLQIKIYDATGCLVKQFTQLLNDQLPNNQVVWSGDDDLGRKVSSGVYFVRLENDNYKEIEKVILLK